MFWKKKKYPKAMVFLESNDARRSFRVCPPLSEPICIEFREKNITVKNIGAAGIAFENQGFAPGDSQRIVFDLPRENATISVTAEIISIDPDGMCHCRFLGLNEDGHNAIHRYLLAVQIEQLRDKKKGIARISPAEKPAGPHKLVQAVAQKLPNGRGTYRKHGRASAARE